MKQKMVIKVDMHGHKSRSKALQIVVGIYGVTSASLGEKDKSQLEVIGEGVDAVKLTRSLRKRLGKWPHCTCLLPRNKAYAELISVSEVKEEKKEEKKEAAQPLISSIGGYGMPQFVCQEVVRDHDPYPCSIM
ncbi:disease resistance protein Pik-1-like [Mercurialis annua]|uniref:disease resistance protein Pik-1-like n=1 Tax=Mercurialis annua TaxID=3986 RepID=UPI00215E39FD|nr:disease resistance protein Pik-1-like [Mercurialis annua]